MKKKNFFPENFYFFGRKFEKIHFFLTKQKRYYKRKAMPKNEKNRRLGSQIIERSQKLLKTISIYSICFINHGMKLLREYEVIQFTLYVYYLNY